MSTPSIPSPYEASVEDVLLAIKEAIEVLQGDLGDPNNRAVTRGEIDGIIEQYLENNP